MILIPEGQTWPYVTVVGLTPQLEHLVPCYRNLRPHDDIVAPDTQSSNYLSCSACFNAWGVQYPKFWPIKIFILILKVKKFRRFRQNFGREVTLKYLVLVLRGNCFKFYYFILCFLFYSFFIYIYIYFNVFFNLFYYYFECSFLLLIN